MSLTLQSRLNHKTAPTLVSSEVAVLASLKAIEQDAETARKPLDLVIVMDVSGSMAGESKLELCKKTLQFVVKQVSDQDLIALVTFDTDVKVVFPGAKMTKVNKKKLLAAVRGLRPGSSTNLSGGLFTGIEVLKSVTTSEIPAICLLTDGQMNHGETDRKKIVAIMNSLLSDFPAKRAKPSVFTFGYGQDADSNVLNEIAQATGGGFYAIHNPESVPLSFADCLGGLMQVAAQNIELTCEVSGGGEIGKVLTGFPTQAVSKFCSKVQIKDMYCGETRDILFKVQIPKGESTVQVRLAVKYVDTVHACGAAVSCLNEVERSSGDQLPTGDGDLEVAKHLVRMEAAKAMEEARIAAEAGDYDGATSKMKSVSDHTKAKQKSWGMEKDLMMEELCDDLKTSVDVMKSKSVYEIHGRSHAMQQESSHLQQRSNKVDKMMANDAELQSAYATTFKKSMMKSAKQAFGYAD